MPEIVAKDVTGGAVAPKETPPIQETPQETPPKVDLEKQRMDQLIRREKHLRARAREIEAKEREFSLKQAPPPPNSEEINAQWKQRIAQDPLNVLAEAGLNHQQLAEILLNANPQDLGLQQMKRENEALKNEIAEIKKSLDQGQEQSVNQALKQIGIETRQLLRTAPEEYEAISKAGESGVQAVVQLIKKVFDTEGYVMDVNEAAQDVEEYLLDQALEYTKLKKIQSKLNPTPPQEAVPKTAPQKQQPQTLTRQIVQSQTKPLTQKERRERAIAAFVGKPVNT